MFGVGIRNSNLFSYQYGADMEGRTIHSQYLQIAADNGFVGLGLYLAVLALLHRGTFIRYELPRTNGEYADQLRPRRALHRPFLGLTGVFEVKWYGERACAAEDYRACRELAEEIRVGSLAAGEPALG